MLWQAVLLSAVTMLQDQHFSIVLPYDGIGYLHLDARYLLRRIHELLNFMTYMADIGFLLRTVFFVILTLGQAWRDLVRYKLQRTV